MLKNLLLHFKTLADYIAKRDDTKNYGIPSDSITFVDESRRINTFNTDYYCGTSQLGSMAYKSSLYDLTIQGNGTTIGTFDPNGADKTINITPEILGALSNDDGKAIAKAIADAVARAQEAYSYTDNLRNQFDAHEHDYAPTNHTHPYLPLTGGEVNGNVTVAGEVSVNGANINVTQGNVYAEGFIHRGGGASDLLTADGGLVPKANFAPAKKYAELDADDNLNVMGNINANGNLHTYGTVSVESGSSDDILMADGSFQSIQELKNAISSVHKLSIKVVSALPATGDESTIYLLKSGGDEGNLYTEYLYVNGAWEVLGALSNDDGKAIAKAIAEAVARAQEAYSYTDNLRNQFDAHTHPYLPLTGGTVTGNLNVSGTLYADQIKGYSENSTNLTLGTGDNSGCIWITDDMIGKNKNGEYSWEIGANTGYATFSSVSQTSDQRLKENIHDVDKSFTEKYWATENGLIHEYDWIKSGKHANGMIAQELLNYIPEAVNHNVENDTYSVDYTSATCKMMGAIFKKIKELENEITTLKQEIKKLKNNN